MKSVDLLCLILIIITFIGCDNTVTMNDSSPKDNASSLDELYLKAVADAMYAEPYEISDKLISIVNYGDYTAGPGNLKWMKVNGQDYVLGLTLVKEKYKQGYVENIGVLDTTGNWESWITVVPELKDFFIYYSVNSKDAGLRVKQLLGMNWKDENNYFVEMWVRVSDLFRPSADPETNDTKSELYFRADTDSAHIKWFNSRLGYVYSGSSPYPWTRLGYTYDWGSKSDEIGLSEFVVRPNSPYIVQAVYSLEEYIK